MVLLKDSIMVSVDPHVLCTIKTHFNVSDSISQKGWNVRYLHYCILC